MIKMQFILAMLFDETLAEMNYKYFKLTDKTNE